MHSHGNHGCVPNLIAIAAATGVAGCPGEQSHSRPSADTPDVGRLCCRAPESGPADSRPHAVAEGIALHDIAALVGHRLEVPVAPVAAEQHFGHLSLLIGLDNPAPSQLTPDALGRTLTRPGLLTDLAHEHTVRTGADSTSAA